MYIYLANLYSLKYVYIYIYIYIYILNIYVYEYHFYKINVFFYIYGPESCKSTVHITTLNVRILN